VASAIVTPMKLPRFNIRDLFWLVLVVGLALCWGLEYSRSRRLGMEMKYLTSAARPIDVIETPLEDVVHYLSRVHDIPIEMDWENLAPLGLTRKTLITLRLIDGSLVSTIQHVLHGHENVRIVSSETGIRVTTKDAAGEDSLELPPLTSAAERRLFALIQAVGAEGYRVNFTTGARAGQEEVTLERVAAP
jgi:hypothetical protein